MEKLDRALRAYCEREQIGGVMRITVKEKVAYEASFGLADREKKLPFTPKSVFTFYSMTKPFCAIGLLRLADRGLLSLDSHPGTVLPEAARLHPRLTFRHLLHHVSGLPDPVQDDLFPEEEPSATSEEVRRLLPRLADFPNLWEPGEGARYSNINFVLCALAIENVSGLSFGDYMKKEIFEPLGMTALVDRPGLAVPHRVIGYEREDGRLVPATRVYRWMLGAGDMLGTVEDAFALNRIVKRRLLLKEETWDQVLTPSPLNGMGMGCTVKPFYGKYQIRHNGGSRGFRALHVYLPEEDFDLILLSNSGFGSARKDLAAIVNEHFFGKSTGVDDVAMDTGYLDK